MRIEFDFKPTIFKVFFVLLLIGGSFFPLEGEVRFAYEILWYPFSFFLHFPPFVAQDKPWFVSRVGIITAAILWACLGGGLSN